MSRKTPEFQPGSLLYDVVCGAFRAHGTTLEGWSKANGFMPQTIRQVVCGLSRRKTERLLARIIDAADRTLVTDVYLRRLTEHYEQFKREVA